MKLIIAGSRGFNDPGLLEKSVLSFLKKHRKDGEDVEIVSGHARGADRLGEEFAVRYGLKVISMPAEWDKHGKAAGHIRNKEMAEIATHCIVFFDGNSSGSKNMIEISKNKSLIYQVIYF